MFALDWLQERYSLDARARCRKVQAEVLQYFAAHPHLQIIDVGAGAGANICYYSPLLAARQRWILVEHDPNLCSRLAELQICQKGGRLSSIIVQGSLLELAEEHLYKTDLVVANAVFDLFSERQFRQFLRPFSERCIPLLTTLNYTSMQFVPEQEIDRHYISLYERHMLREQPFGRAMGAHCAREMVAILEESGYKTTTGESQWRICGDDQKMAGYMLGFMEGAIGELLPSQERQPLQQWCRDKRLAIRGRSMELLIEHVDIFAVK